MAKVKPRKYPINEALREIMDEHGLTYRATAKLLFISPPTVFSWFRSKPSKAKPMALALLCYQLGLKPHPLLEPKTKGRARG